MNAESRYPSFNVLNELEEWDDHSQHIVTSRIDTAVDYQFLIEQEAALLFSLCRLLVDDDSPDVLTFVIAHIDQTLASSPGEGQRKVGVPAAPELIRQGISAIEQASLQQHSVPFTKLSNSEQKQIIQAMSSGSAAPAEVWNGLPQKDLFDKLLRLTVESYCSHPSVWSEIGYAGPAYPRGYVRTKLGQLDPWEAKAEDES